ncbi:hypothetical protein LTR95_001274 [Oleoguttula sp. CCFEE 5521]
MRSTRGYDEDDDLTMVRSNLSRGTRRTSADDDYSEATSRHTQPRERRRRRRRRSPSVRSMSSDSDTDRRSYTREPDRDLHDSDEKDGKHDSIAYAILALGVFSMLAGVLRLRRDKRGDNARNLHREEQARRVRQEDFEQRKRERRRREDMEAERRYRDHNHDDQESVSELKTITYVPTEAPRSPRRGPRRLEPPSDERDDRSRAPSRTGRSEAGSVGTQRTGHHERDDNASRADSAIRSKRQSRRSRSDDYDSSSVGYPRRSPRCLSSSRGIFQGYSTFLVATLDHSETQNGRVLNAYEMQ